MVGLKRYGVIFGMALLLALTFQQINASAQGEYREFLNDRNKPEADYSGDDREVFRIIEVIPHDACSIFPYLIDWKTEEEYNRNVPIGYEGLVYGASNTGSVMMFETDTSDRKYAYTVVAGGLKRDCLNNYDVPLATINEKNSGNWWREEQIKEIKQESGYFEYVGEGKGLYYINTEAVKGEKGKENGINYEVQALPRKGTDEKKGEYEVKNPGYYWAEDYNGQTAYPTEEVLSCTGFNYDLAFYADSKTENQEYRVYNVKEKREGADEKESYDYFIKILNGKEEDYEFVRHKGGNYIQKNGRYQHAGAGKGEYVVKNNGLCEEAVWRTRNDILFEYAGEGQGLYDVSFIYAGDGTKGIVLYGASLKQVSNGKGRYGLTSASALTLPDGTNVPEYIKKDKGDYDKVITSIDHAGIDYEDTRNGYYTTEPPYGPGVRIGRWAYDYNTERGGWVFHAMDELSEENYTRLMDVADKKTFQQGERIYVSAQSRIYRYYCKNSFRNNEWFKLLCYLDNPGNPSVAYSDNSNGMGYDSTLSSGMNLVKAKEILNSFNNTFRIEVLQRTPEELTKEEVESAGLIYISDAAGIESLVENWNGISEHLKNNGQQGLKPLPSGVNNSKDFRFEGDLKNDVLLAIYDRCIYKNEGALMAAVGLRENYMVGNLYAESEKNLGKLTLFMDLMEDARDFAYFIEGYEETSDTFNLIHEANGGEALEIEVWPRQLALDKDGHEKEMYNVSREGESSWQSCFHIDYFEAPEKDGIEVSFKGQEYTGTYKTSVGKVLEGETKYYSEWYGVASFKPEDMHKIWQILHNRKDRGKILVQITNAHLTYGENKKRVIYGDEFDPESFTVKYKILLRGAMAEFSPPLSDTRIFFDDNQNGIWDEGEIGFTNTGQQYQTEDAAHERNVREGFEDTSSEMVPKLLNPEMTMRKLVVQASNTEGKTGASDVWIIVREGFDLN